MLHIVSGFSPQTDAQADATDGTVSTLLIIGFPVQTKMETGENIFPLSGCAGVLNSQLL